jgi:MEMO1 family protein
MSIVAAAIVPHPPILLPTVGRDNVKKVEQTRLALARLGKFLVEKEIDTILIISPHGYVQKDVFTVNLSPDYICNFEDFGDFDTKITWKSDIELIHKTRESLESTSPLQLVNNSELDYGSAVPLYFLTENLPKAKIIPLYYSGLSYADHFEFGKQFKKIIDASNKRVAIVCSGDLSHKITRDAPAGYSPRGKKFDKKLIDLLLANKTKEILEMDKTLIEDAGECGLRSILIAKGIIDKIKNTPKLLSYEAPFGVGYLVMNFEI